MAVSTQQLSAWFVGERRPQAQLPCVPAEHALPVLLCPCSDDGGMIIDGTSAHPVPARAGDEIVFYINGTLGALAGPARAAQDAPRDWFVEAVASTPKARTPRSALQPYSVSLPGPTPPHPTPQATPPYTQFHLKTVFSSMQQGAPHPTTRMHPTLFHTLLLQTTRWLPASWRCVSTIWASRCTARRGPCARRCPARCARARSGWSCASSCRVRRRR